MLGCVYSYRLFHHFECLFVVLVFHIKFERIIILLLLDALVKVLLDYDLDTLLILLSRTFLGGLICRFLRFGLRILRFFIFLYFLGRGSLVRLIGFNFGFWIASRVRFWGWIFWPFNRFRLYICCLNHLRGFLL